MRGATRYIIDDWDLKEFDEDDFIEDVSDSTLLSECTRRGISTVEHVEVPIADINYIANLSKMKLHDLLADVVGVQHTCDNDTILNELKRML